MATDAEFMKQYWFGTQVISQWKAGSPWKMVWPDGTVADTGEIVEAEAPRRLVIRWEHQAKPEIRGAGPSLSPTELAPIESAVKLSITHTIERDASKFIEAVSGGWPKILSNLKSLLEGGAAILTEPHTAKR